MIFDFIRKLKGQKPVVSTDDRFLVEFFGYDNGFFGPLILTEKCFDTEGEAVEAICETAAGYSGLTGMKVTRLNTGENTCRDVTEDFEEKSYQQWEDDNLHFYGWEDLPALYSNFECVQDIPEYQDYLAELNRADHEYEKQF